MANVQSLGPESQHKDLTTVTSRDGTIIHVHAKGNYKAPHMILAPGFSTTLAAFDCLFDDPKMYNSLYMVRFDPRGQGLSGKPATPEFYTSDRYADDIKAIIEAFKLRKPFFLGWSIAASMAADIAAHFPHPLPFSGVIAMAGALFRDLENMTKIASPLAMNLLMGLIDTSSASTALQTRIDFVNAQFANPDSVLFSVKCAWLGGAAYTLPEIGALIGSRTQDPRGLKEAGQAGWPFLGIEASEDKIAVKGFMSRFAPLFKDNEVHMIEGAGHAVFYDKQAEVVELILAFVKRVIEGKAYP